MRVRKRPARGRIAVAVAGRRVFKMHSRNGKTHMLDRVEHLFDKKNSTTDDADVIPKKGAHEACETNARSEEHTHILSLCFRVSVFKSYVVLH